MGDNKVNWLIRPRLEAINSNLPKVSARLHDALSECAHHVLESWWERAQFADDPITEFKDIFASEAERLAVTLAAFGELMVHHSAGTYAEWQKTAQ